MCGIFCSVARHGHVVPSKITKERLLARGPDASKEVLLRVDGVSSEEPMYLTLFSTVLSLRGCATIEQPFQRGGSETALCWNGEAWKIRDQRPHENDNDTSAVYDVLSSALDHVQSPGMGLQDSAIASASIVSRTLALISGPYAFVYYNKDTSRLFFGRDFLGRRSLLWKVGENQELLLSSVGDGSLDGSWTEVEADGIYCIDLASKAATMPTAAEGCAISSDLHMFKVPYTFSYLSDNNNSVIPQLSLKREQSETYRLDEMSPSVSTLDGLLRESLSSRVFGIPEPPEPPCQSMNGHVRRKAKMAVLFSGGLDCTLLVRICHDILPLDAAIDLLNVAFQNPRAHKHAGDGAYELCPDRITGRNSHAELRRICPGRTWRFVAIDIPYTEYRDHRTCVMELISPHNTEMDLSIASALYFAARGTGTILRQESDQLIPYTTEARVLLSGLGADELFAGYTRHATAFRRQGLEGLLDELGLDVARLGKRNLGRDDRVISHWAKEARFPFLDEDVVHWALKCPISGKCDFGAETGIGDLDHDSCAAIESGKKVLRCLAWKLGMKEVAKEKKRAIQFGARTAKMETGKTKGTTLLA